MIPQRNISLIANELAAASSQRIPEAVIERDYVLAWFLTCLADHPLREWLAFKGGTALRRCWIEGYRFSEDMDFTLTERVSLDDILAGFSEIHTTVASECGVQFQFSRKARRQGQNSHTFYLRYQGPLPAPNDVKVDITINEALCFPLQERPILRQYERFDDLPEGPAIRTYSLEEMVLEKTAAMTDAARNEPRDLFDLWYLLKHYDLWLEGMKPALEAKLEFRGRKTENILQVLAAKEDRLRGLWDARLSQQVIELPPFGNVYRSVRQALRSLNL